MARIDPVPELRFDGLPEAAQLQFAALRLVTKRQHMAEERLQRRLAAILAADVAAYSRLMGADEEGTLARLKAHRRDLVDLKINEHRGRIVKTTGDGMLVEFASVVDALRCATEIQRGMVERNAEVPPAKRIALRIGINVGDIIIEGGDIYGDGVNVAARLEALAEPGGICVSGRVQEDARGKLDVAFEDAGEQRLKNIAWPVRVYRVRLAGDEGSARLALPLPDKPSIAVLPFQNLSGDPEQEYFADGIVEEIITALSRMRWLFVIARNSSFTYKGRAVDVKQVGRELGVRYVLEGSVRKSANRVRITGQLIDASTGAHLWADRFDSALEDIFDLQDQVTASVMGALLPKLEQAEIERAGRKPTESLDAYDYFLRGMASLHQGTKESIDEALLLLDKAVERDRHFASAHGMAAWCYALRKWNGWIVDQARETADCARLARRAVARGKDDAVALCTGGFAIAFYLGEVRDGAAFIDRALALNPNLATAWHFGGWVSVWLGEPDVAIDRVMRAMRLSPFDPFTFLAQGSLALAHFAAGRYDEAMSWAQESIREKPNFLPSIRIFAASCAMTGRQEDAREAIARVRQLNPTFRLSDVKDLYRASRPDDLARYEEALRKAGLPQ
jgi:TolB-like protein/class 3 adenylate cyclase